MPVYKAPVTDTEFVLNEVIKLQQYAGLPGFEEATPDLITAILSEGAKFVEEVTQPLNQVGDETGCTRHPDGTVSTPPGFREAYEAVRQVSHHTLVSAVDEDDLFTVDSPVRLHKTLPNSQLAIIPGKRHAFQNVNLEVMVPLLSRHFG